MKRMSIFEGSLICLLRRMLGKVGLGTGAPPALLGTRQLREGVLLALLGTWRLRTGALSSLLEIQGLGTKITSGNQ